MVRSTFLVAAALAAGVATAQERSISEFYFDYEQMAETGYGSFEVTMTGVIAAGASATMDATFRYETELINGSVLLTDEVRFGGRTIRHESSCEAAGAMRPESGSRTMSRGDRVIQATYIVDGSERIDLAGGRHVQSRMPYNVLTEQAALRIIGQLPQDAEQVFTFSAYAETFDANVAEPVDGETYSIRFAGDDEHGARFDIDSAKNWSAWVNENGYVVRIEADAGTTVMTRVDDTVYAAADEPTD